MRCYTSSLGLIFCLLSQVSAEAHDSFALTVPVNPPLGEAERANQKLKLLTERGRRVGVAASAIAAAQGVIFDKFKWTKSNIRVCFWNGSEQQQNEIMQLASVWERAAPSISFIYKSNGSNRICKMSDMNNTDLMSDIRVNLDANDRRLLWSSSEDKHGDWSYIGRQVSQDSQHPTTMNLVGALKMLADNLHSSYKFNVRHEFGHALALMHEHQRKVCAGWFDFKAIAKNTNWSEAVVKQQIDSLPEGSNVYKFLGIYDPDSIMQYNFLSSWYAPDRQGQKNPCRRRDEVSDLSELDKITIAYIYDPTMNDSPDRVAFIKEHKIDLDRSVANNGLVELQNKIETAQVAASLANFGARIRVPERITIQVYPHQQDKDLVLRAVADLGYPLVDKSGNKIRNVSSNVTKFLANDPTTTVFYSEGVSDFDARFVAWSLIRQGIAIKSIQHYYPVVATRAPKRKNLIQIGASINARGLKILTEEQILTSSLPMYGTKE